MAHKHHSSCLVSCENRTADFSIEIRGSSDRATTLSDEHCFTLHSFSIKEKDLSGEQVYFEHIRIWHIFYKGLYSDVHS